MKPLKYLFLLNKGISRSRAEWAIELLTEWVEFHSEGVCTLEAEIREVDFTDDKFVPMVGDDPRTSEIEGYWGLPWDIFTQPPVGQWALGKHTIFFVYHNKIDRPGLANLTWIYDKRPTIQAVWRPEWPGEPWDAFRHEHIHSLFANLRLKGVAVEDELDKREQEIGVAAEDEQVAKFAPYWNLLAESLPIDKTIYTLLAIIDLLKKAIALLANRPSINKLARAMADFEGFFTVNSRAWRNNNPLNLRFSPFTKSKDNDGFCVFNSQATGWEAGKWDLRQKQIGNTKTGLGPESTIKDLIYIWTVDNQKAYLDFVASNLHISPTMKLKEFA